MTEETVKMPDGADFVFWDDRTEYTRTYHVACEHPNASDANPGTEDLPFATINRPAELAQPCQKVLVHRGVYRECVRPARGGEGPDNMIAYEAAAGEEVTITGAEQLEGPFEPCCGWKIPPARDGATVWTADLPAERFVGYNPFSAILMFPHYLTFINDWTEGETHRLQCRRGMVFANGQALRQVFRVAELAESDGVFWVEEPGLRIHFRLHDDTDPNATTLEVSAREQVFAPRVRRLGYIRVSGFRLECAAGCLPVPQRGLISPSRGHHWIIEDCSIRWAGTCGLDLGKEDWSATPHEPCGGHIVRRNIIADCGICGIAGASCVDDSLIEDNLFERIGWQNLERLLECAGLKFHVAEGVLLRRNVFRHIRHAAGVWLDVLNKNCRVTQNVFADIHTFIGACYIECSHHPNLVDGNVFWDIHDTPEVPRSEGARPVQGGVGFNGDTGENITVTHNFFGRIPDHFAVSLHLRQHGRMIAGRSGLCRRHKVLNNVFVECPKQIIFGRAEENSSDGNLFDEAHDAASFRIDYPLPQTFQNLQGWREYYGLDVHSSQGRIEADFDPETLTLRWKVDGLLPACQDVGELYGLSPYAGAGPFNAEQWRQIESGGSAAIVFNVGSRPEPPKGAAESPASEKGKK